jgi:hypothetical protein
VKRTLQRGTLASSVRSLVAAAQESSAPVAVTASGPSTSGEGGDGGDAEAAVTASGVARVTKDALITSEEKHAGALQWSDMKFYLRALGGAPSMVVILAVFVLERVFYVATDWWLSLWVRAALRTALRWVAVVVWVVVAWVVVLLVVVLWVVVLCVVPWVLVPWVLTAWPLLPLPLH